MATRPPETTVTRIDVEMAKALRRERHSRVPISHSVFHLGIVHANRLTEDF